MPLQGIGIAAAVAGAGPRGWPIRPPWQAFWLSVATTITVVGGGYAAYAAWAPAAEAGTLVLNTVLLPTGNRPTAVVHGTRVSVTWRASESTNDRRALTYVVSRTGAGFSTEACVVTTTTCRELGVPAGTWRYTVRPDLGPWQGRDSPPGAPVTVPAGAAPAEPKRAGSKQAGSKRAGPKRAGPKRAGPKRAGPPGSSAASDRPGDRPGPAAPSAPARAPAVEAIGDRPWAAAATAGDAATELLDAATEVLPGGGTGPAAPRRPGSPADYRSSSGGTSSGR
ncbi:hypothetical protein [Actinoplanes sp. NPDC049599]|uniref:hypothetical protein n=1 Tax=Actinoplanes sp. NPDC049599 TaxID=3363903 RepID=UPI0037968E95